jgi:hypothetical protein
VSRQDVPHRCMSHWFVGCPSTPPQLANPCIDLHVKNDDWPILGITPLIGGHEGVGEIVAIGEHTQNSPVKLGDRVGIKWLAYACSNCEIVRDFCHFLETFFHLPYSAGKDSSNCAPRPRTAGSLLMAHSPNTLSLGSTVRASFASIVGVAHRRVRCFSHP